jgi:hypothetical protein
MISRRAFLRGMTLAGAVALSPAGRLLALDPLYGDPPPQTEFEASGGAAWTSHAGGLDFLAEIADRSPRVRLEVIGASVAGRPLQLVTIGAPGPRDAAGVRSAPSTLFVCTQHGNEPAGREAGLQLVRDLAFTADAAALRQLEDQAVLVIPTANPDGRERNIRTSGVTDINRDHLNLTQPETQAIHRVIRDVAPDVILDLHEYGPTQPVVYDADVLYLWPRNLNVDPGVHALSKLLCEGYIAPGACEAGYTADEYGLYKAAGIELTQVAGNEDEGICRNSVGLRHSLGILIKSAVSQSLYRGVEEEVVSATQNRLRRVASQVQTTRDALRFMSELGEGVHATTVGAAERAGRDGADGSRPVYFRGADNDPPDPADIDDPPPSRYELTAAQAASVDAVLDLHGIERATADGAVSVPMG